MARALLSMRSSFCTVFFQKDTPACFGFTPIPKCTVSTWRLKNYPCVAGRSFSAGINRAHCSAQWVPFTDEPYHPCANELLEA